MLSIFDFQQKNKIVIIGPPGSGKTSLANSLKKLLGFSEKEIHHLDERFWNPGWLRVPDAERKEIISQIIKNQRWIIEGNYTDSLEILFSAAELVIFLDFPRYLSLFRIFQRRLKWFGQKIPDVAPGCPDKIDLDFLGSVWMYPYHDRVIVQEFLNRLGANVSVAVLRNPEAVNSLIKIE